MKKVIIPIFMLVMLSFKTSDTELTKSEREFAINELTNSRDHLLNVLDGLSQEQLNYKSSESSWSIAECTEHITIFENEVFEILEESLELPPNPEGREGLVYSDKELLAHVANRTKKAKTQQEYEPNGKYGDHNLTVKEFKAKREKHINYISATKDDLRNHFVNFGAADTYQIILYMSSHTERHIQQINEVKANKDFPKN
jgi:uncharacterized damage-inducible protein DinB